MYFKMDVWCDTRTYNVLFWAPSDRDVSKLDSYNNVKEFLQRKGLSVFDRYDVPEKYRISAHIPITTSIPEIIEPIMEQLKAIRDK